MKHEDLNSQGGVGNPGWDSVQNVPFKRSQEVDKVEPKVPRFSLPKIEINHNYESDNYPKRRRKIIGLLDWKARQANLDSLDNPESEASKQLAALVDSPDNHNLNPAIEKSVLYDIKDGVISPLDEKWATLQIKTPIDLEGPERTLENLTNKYERRLLTRFSGIGYKNLERIDKKIVQDLIDKYPYPENLEHNIKIFIRDVETLDGAPRAKGYKEAQTSFMQKIYGERYECYKDFKELHKEAQALPPTPNRLDRLPKNIGFASISRSALKDIQGQLARKSHNDEEYQNALLEAVLKNSNKDKSFSEDSILIDENKELYGIFDGSSDSENDRASAKLANRLVNTLTDRYRTSSGRNLASILTLASGRLVRARWNDQEVGTTTGILAKINEDEYGSRMLSYANAGDSQIFIVHQDGKALPLIQNEDQTNYLGANPNRKYNNAGIMYQDNKTGRTDNVTEFGDYPLEQGDRIVLCSGGMIGDENVGLISSDKLGFLVSNTDTPTMAADAILTGVQKEENRFVIVADAYPNEETKFGSFLDRFFKRD